LIDFPSDGSEPNGTAADSPAPAVAVLRRCHSPKELFGRKTFLFFDGEVVLFSAQFAKSNVQIVSSAAPGQLSGILKAKRGNRSFELVGVIASENFSCQVGTVHEAIVDHRYFVVDLHVGDEQHRLHS
jgi:hypothetical protein